jgi:hypothetical protein
MLSRFGTGCSAGWRPVNPASPNPRMNLEEYAGRLLRGRLTVPRDLEGRYVLQKVVLCLLLLLVPAAGLAGYGDDFYEGLYARGMAHFHASEYQAAFTDLHLAAFGFVDQLDRFETAEAYAAIAAHRLGNEALTRCALVAIAKADGIQPHFRSIAIPDALRAELDRAAALLLTSEERAVLRIAGQTQHPSAAR